MTTAAGTRHVVEVGGARAEIRVWPTAEGCWFAMGEAIGLADSEADAIADAIALLEIADTERAPMADGWRVVVFASAGESFRLFPTERQAREYAARAHRAGCLARVERAS